MKVYIRNRILAIFVFSLSLFFSLMAAEFILHMINKNKFYVYPPNMRKIFRPRQDIMLGVSGDAIFRTNSFGIRGDEFSPAQDYRILAIGGSTTECLYLDQNETWTYLLQGKLNSIGKANFWVGSVGVSGKTSADNLMHIKYLLPQYPRIDCVIALIGINDLAFSFFENKKYSRAKEIEQIRRAFYIVPFDKISFSSRRMMLWNLFNKAKDLILYRDRIQDPAGKIYQKWKQDRRDAQILDTLPDLSQYLAEYSVNINAMVDLAASSHVRLIFLTQPTIWRSDLSRQEQDLLWWGFSTERKFYSVKAMSEGMRRFNDTLISICRKRGVEYIDVANILPKDTSVFYDDAHFNENGSRLLSEEIYKYLLVKDSFNRGGR